MQKNDIGQGIQARNLEWGTKYDEPRMRNQKLGINTKYSEPPKAGPKTRGGRLEAKN